ncbi:hypothetical protein PDE_02327 [Penicillium oxalicum 114-2]|uniref:Wings apart-like protein C-terminal domain-containing protein n=1 Tax=Penicillium oxalicum (strain 114-2 / CGMCC 5302) TaxID=933388 RepID=S7ZAX9_PENO1|nr:hypothetical protein PDE_02327 [Penicillium oxalicum 114-2]
MDQSHIKARRLVTYGSSARQQPPTEAADVRSDRAGPARLSRTLTGEQPKNNRQRKLPNSEKTLKPNLSVKSRNSGDDSIYDLPSSDEENSGRGAQRKRRRHGGEADKSAATSHVRLSGQALVVSGSSGPEPRSISTAPGKAEFKSSIKTTQPRALQNGSPRADLQSRERKLHQSPVPTNTGRSPRVPTSAATTTTTTTTTTTKNKDPRQTVLGIAAKTRDDGCGSVYASSKGESQSSNSQKLSRNYGMPKTSTRKRLIDTLGTPERSLDASSVTPNTSPSSTPSTAQSARNLSKAPSPILRPDMTLTDQEQDSTRSAAPPHLTGSRVTYARQRSFLDDLVLSAGLSGQGDSESDIISNSQPRELDCLLPRTRPIEVEELSQEDGAVRSIHELRRAGGNARYRGAIESIFEDLEDSSLSASGRCSALIQLCEKMLDAKSARQFAECNFDKRLVESLSSELGTVSAALALCVFSLSSLGRPIPHTLASAALPRLLEVSPKLLPVRQDLGLVARDRNANLSKSTQTSVHDLALKVKITLFPSDSVSVLSPCLLALHTLNLTLSAIQSKGEIPEGISTPTLHGVVNVLLSEKDCMQDQGSGSQEGYRSLRLSLSIIEAYSVLDNRSQDDQRDVLGALADLHDLLRIEKSPNSEDYQVQTLYLRVLLNITNSNPALCDTFATANMIDNLSAIAVTQFGHLTENTLAQDNDSLNTVILALGALINMVEKSAASRRMFLRSTSAPQSILDQLLRLFSARVDSIAKAHSVVEVHHNVAVGYLAVLLLALCLDGEARSQIQESLKPQGLASIMSTVNEFLQHHRKIEQEIQSASVRKEASGFLVRLQDLVNEVQRIDNE